MEDENEVLDYQTLHIYAEGIEPRDKNEKLRHSVSAEFECIDRIYEENILEGIIGDAEGGWDAALQILRGKPIGILGVDKNSLDAYNLLLAYEIDICCFISDNQSQYDTYLLGKRVMGREEAAINWGGGELVFIGVEHKNSAWGFGGTNKYHYLGYPRNRRFFLLRDYFEDIPNGMLHILKRYTMHLGNRLIFVGDERLCFMIKCLLNDKIIPEDKLVFCDIFEEYTSSKKKMSRIGNEEIQNNDICLLVLPEYNGCMVNEKTGITYRKKLENKYKEELRKHGITYVLEYHPENNDLLKEYKTTDDGNVLNLKSGKIVIGAINSCSGNVLFNGILDNHPDILIMSDTFLSRNLYSICERLAWEPSDLVLSIFWDILEKELPHYTDYQEYSQDKRDVLSHICREIPQKDIFNQCMKQILAQKERFSSQELFVALHIAYAKMFGKEVKKISDAVIYWEPHNVPRDQCEEYLKWLSGIGAEGFIVNIVRNAYIRAGSHFQCLDEEQVLHWIEAALSFPNEEKKVYLGWKRVVLKFEELKRNPENEMREFCRQTGMEWSDTFLEVSSKYSYKEVRGFDVEPVYRTWEKYFSAFDRFRISLITGPWQKKYGYPYIDILDFNRRELQEMFIKKFRFEENQVFDNEEQEIFFLKRRERWITVWLWKVRRMNILEGALMDCK